MAGFRFAGIAILGSALALAAGLAAREYADAPAPDRLGQDRSLRPTIRVRGTLRLFSEAPVSLDPRDVESVYESLPVNQIFDGLVRLDPSLNVMPSLAQTWTISRDGLVYTFRLRDGVRFHDGSELTADDVVFSLRRALDPRSGKRSVAVTYMVAVAGAADFASGRRGDLPGVRALDARTVEIRLDRPSPPFLEVLALDYLRVLPEKTVTALGDDVFRRAPVGTGPFRFVSKTAERMVLRANREYFLGAPYLAEVHLEFPAAGETDRGEARFTAGDLDAIEPGPEASTRLSNRPGVSIHKFQELSVSFLGLATGHPNFEDARVRRAVAHAVDRDAIVAAAPATRRVATGILPPGLPGYSPGIKTLPFDLEKSRSLLAESGHPGGAGLRPFTIYVSPGSLPTSAAFRKLEADLRSLGFPCEVKKVGWPELFHRLEGHDAPAFILGWIADLADPDAFLATLFAPEAAGNYFEFRDAETTRLLDAGAAETSAVARTRAYRTVERRILEEAPFVPLYHSVGTVARRSSVHGLDPGPLGLAALDLEDVWIAERTR